MAFVVVYDACVLYPFSLRDLLIRLAQADLFQAKWTAEILDECFGNLKAKHPDKADQLDRTRTLMGNAVRDWEVVGHESLVEGLELPDPDDRHVLAAAIEAGAQVIVTFNTKHFPASSLGPHGIDAHTPDTFVGHVFDLDEGLVCRVLAEQAGDLRNPPMTAGELLDRLEQHALAQTAARIRRSEHFRAA